MQSRSEMPTCKIALVPSFYYKPPANSHSRKNLAQRLKNEPETHYKRKGGETVKTVTDKNHSPEECCHRNEVLLEKRKFITNPVTVNLKYF